jgi:glycosidase
MKRIISLMSLLVSILLVSCDLFAPQPTPYDHELNYRTYYQLLVYSFADSNGDGIGDFKGIAQKIPYFKALGIEGIYLSPIHPSSAYHGYDVTDYYAVKSVYEVDGYTFDDLVSDLAAEDIVVILDLVVNHSGSNHLWFYEAQDAFARGTESRYLNWYNFSKTRDAKHPWGFAGAYYEGIFSSSMPDFNFDEPEVVQEFINIGKYWMEKGVAGFRLDAAMHIFTDYSGGDKWNGDILDKNIDFWLTFRDGISQEYPHLYMVGEVWTAQPKLERYYQTGIDSLFNFDFAGRALGQLSGNASLARGLDTHQRNIRDYWPIAIEANFLSNHDKPRLSTSLNNQNWLKMLGGMLVLSPGNSFLYYGEEVGLRAQGTSNIADRVYRTPMPWGNDAVTDSFSYGNGPGLTSTTVSGQSALEQMNDPQSLFSYYQAAISLKNNHFELRAGEVSFVNSGSSFVASYTVTHQGVTSLVVHNASANAFTFTPPQLNLSHVRDSLSVSGQASTLLGNVLSLPPFSSTIIAVV